ncbi:hypothetical protein AQ715_21595 [Burkholderia pseudomallei]|nr:hypothetical protein AQ715_21595 [Burkholderia pseudomallei]
MFPLEREQAMHEPVAVGAETLKVVQNGFMPRLHVAYQRPGMMHFDARLRICGSVFFDWIESAFLTFELAMLAAVTIFFGP